jgi:hypothetical protein
MLPLAYPGSGPLRRGEKAYWATICRPVGADEECRHFWLCSFERASFGRLRGSAFVVSDMNLRASYNKRAFLSPL